MILIVEDNPTHVTLIERAFEGTTLSTGLVFVSSLAEAQTRIHQAPPQLVICDLLLPDGHGTDLIPSDSHPLDYPVIVMTSHGNEQVAVDAMKAGAIDYVVKSPHTLQNLPRVAQRAIREWGHMKACQIAEGTVRQSEARLRAFLDSTAQGVVVTDTSGEIIYTNKRMEEITNYGRNELLFKNFTTLFDPQFQANKHFGEIYFNQTQTSAIVIGLELICIRQDGEIFDASVSLNYLEVGGELQIIFLIADITEQKLLRTQAKEAEIIQQQLEQEKQLRIHKERFISMMSHEFRTPLAVIQSSSNLLKTYYDRLSVEQRQEKFHHIEAKVQELNEMISDLLLLSKSEMNLVEFQPQPTNIINFLKQIVTSIHRRIGTRRIEMSTDLTESEYPIDQYLIDHAISNLLHNAVKYSPEGTMVQFSVRNGDNKLHMEITDRGIGIPRENMKMIFEPFQRASNVGEIEGTGVGLSIVKEFVEIHGGHINCSSQVNIGTTFKIEIPV